VVKESLSKEQIESIKRVSQKDWEDKKHFSPIYIPVGNVGQHEVAMQALSDIAASNEITDISYDISPEHYKHYLDKVKDWETRFVALSPRGSVWHNQDKMVARKLPVSRFNGSNQIVYEICDVFGEDRMVNCGEPCRVKMGSRLLSDIKEHEKKIIESWFPGIMIAKFGKLRFNEGDSSVMLDYTVGGGPYTLNVGHSPEHLVKLIEMGFNVLTSSRP